MAGSEKKDKMIYFRSDEEIALIKISAQVLGKAHAEVNPAWYYNEGTGHSG